MKSYRMIDGKPTIIELPSFEERAKKFKEAVLKAEKKYGVRINAGYINSYDDSENVLIQEITDCEVINEVYFDTLTKQL